MTLPLQSFRAIIAEPLSLAAKNQATFDADQSYIAYLIAKVTKPYKPPIIAPARVFRETFLQIDCFPLVGMHRETRWRLPVSRWCVWPQADTEIAPPTLDFVDSLQRRRLSPLAKAALWVAHQCAHDVANVRMIYASQHGEIARTTEMLEQLAEQEPLSPTAFSMSVLNASVGFYSIIRGATAPATAISAGSETLGYALVEAYGQLTAHRQDPILLIYADETIPEVWNTGNQTRPQALALLLDHRADRAVECELTSITGDVEDSDTSTQAQRLAACLNSTQIECWHGQGRRWRWQSIAA